MTDDREPGPADWTADAAGPTAAAQARARPADRAVIDAILDEGLLCHVAFPTTATT